jgi:MFS family permease
LGSRSTSSTNLLEDSDDLHYRSIGDDIHHYDGSLTESENSLGVPKPPPLLMPQVLIAVINYGFLSFCDMERRVLTPLMWSTSLEHGGLGFTPYTIGLAMGISAAVNLFIQAMFLGRAIRYFGARRVFMVSLVTLFVALACFPLEKYITQRTGATDWRVWTVVIVQLVMYCMVTPAYSKSNALQMLTNIQYVSSGAIQVLITESAPSQSSLGAVNGLAQAVGSVARALAPSVASSLFTISLQRNWAGGNAVYYILMGIVACTIRLSFMLPKELSLTMN